MIIRSGGFYHDHDPPERSPRDIVAPALLLLIVSVLCATIVVVVRALLLTAGR